MFKRKNLISAQIVADRGHALSGKRKTTGIVTLPRIVLAEFNTHRAFSRNSGSSRAIPFKRMKESVKKNLFIPLAFQKHHSGMQGTEYHETGSFKDKLLVFLWWFASRLALISSTLFYKFGATKQLANRILEPFMWHTVVFTATELEGFFRQRCPDYNLNKTLSKSEDLEVRRSWKVFSSPVLDNEKMSKRLSINQSGAEIHISLAAESIYDSLQLSEPQLLFEGEWHIPFKYDIVEAYDNIEDLPVEMDVVRISTALCAMVSFTEVGGKSLFDKINPSKNITLHDRLIEDEHMSPTEHCAQVSRKLKPGEHSNFKGNWLQYRKVVEKNLKR